MLLWLDETLEQSQIRSKIGEWGTVRDEDLSCIKVIFRYIPSSGDGDVASANKNMIYSLWLLYCQ